MKSQSDRKVQSNWITIISFIIIGICLIILSSFMIKSSLEGLKEDCKSCSIFEKDCPYTMEELMEEEYGDDPYCNDLGFYEVRFKIGGMVGITGMIFIGLGIAIIKSHKEKSK